MGVGLSTLLSRTSDTFTWSEDGVLLLESVLSPPTVGTELVSSVTEMSVSFVTDFTSSGWDALFLSGSISEYSSPVFRGIVATSVGSVTDDIVELCPESPSFLTALLDSNDDGVDSSSSPDLEAVVESLIRSFVSASGLLLDKAGSIAETGISLISLESSFAAFCVTSSG